MNNVLAYLPFCLAFLSSLFIMKKKGEVYSKGEGVEYTVNLCKLSLTTQKFTYLFSFLPPPKRCHVIIKRGIIRKCILVGIIKKLYKKVKLMDNKIQVNKDCLVLVIHGLNSDNLVLMITTLEIK